MALTDSTSANNLKQRTAGSLKWNIIDRLSQQVLYAVTGIVLANLLSHDDFGLVGAVLVFQAFAALLVDSGFSYALIQRKEPTHSDYSTVLWFNLAVAIVLYIILYAAAPLIADCFDGDQRLIPLSRVMFLSMILNASAIVQTNRLMKRMDVKMVAVSNALGLVAGAVVGIYLAVAGYGAWAIVWQTVILAAVKSLTLWLTQRWWPEMRFSFTILRGFLSIGTKMMFTSFLNTVFLNIYSFLIGNRVGLTALGYYTQSDKWSKMGIMSVSQVITSTFLPTLSAVQDDAARFRSVAAKINRFTAYLVIPAFIFLAIMAEPIFHTFFGTKWDYSILLFQLLLVRGIFTVLTGLYNNILLAVGNAKIILRMEILRDGLALALLLATMPFINLTRDGNPVYGVGIMIYGQLLASFITWVVTLIYTGRLSGLGVKQLLLALAPYSAFTCAIAVPLMLLTNLPWHPALILAAQVVLGAALYLAANRLTCSAIQSELLAHLLKKS